MGEERLRDYFYFIIRSINKLIISINIMNEWMNEWRVKEWVDD